MSARLGDRLARVVQRIENDTSERDQLILQMHAQGYSYSEIGRYAQLSKAGVRWVLNRHGALDAS